MVTRGNIHVIDDHPQVRSAISALLAAAGYHVDQFPSAERFLLDAQVVSPAVILTDMRMPSMSGLELLKRITARVDCPPVIVMSGESAPQEIIESFKVGALDFLLKPVPNKQLLAAIDKGLALDAANFKRRDDEQRIRRALASLTVREREVSSMIRQGFSNKAIASALQIRADTVKKYRAQIYAKFDVADLAQFLALASACPEAWDSASP
jgi:two-component system response regulator FixJ